MLFHVYSTYASFAGVSLALNVTRDLRSGQPMLFISRRLWSGQIDTYQHDFQIQSQQTIVPTGRGA